MSARFQVGRRYRVTILPAGAKTKTVTFDANYLGESGPRDSPNTTHDFDCRPEAGTQQVRAEAIQDAVDIGVAVYARS